MYVRTLAKTLLILTMSLSSVIDCGRDNDVATKVSSNVTNTDRLSEAHMFKGFPTKIFDIVCLQI